MFWIVVATIAAGLIIAARIYFNVRKVQRARSESWDEKLIEKLRSKGYAPFNDYPVDFFLALPDDAACMAVRTALEGEGFTVDVGPVENDPELHFSLHATKMMRLIVPIMQEMSAHMTEIATQHRGRYDGWTA